MLHLITRPLYWLAGHIFALWARPDVQPEAPAELLGDPGAEVCYVLESGGLADLLALERACRRYGLPSPTSPMNLTGGNETRRVVALRPVRGLLFRRKSATSTQRLKRLVEAAAEPRNVLLVPVSIYWGRSPDKERSLFKILMGENWEVAGRTRKFLATLLHGRNTLLRFSEPLPLAAIIHRDKAGGGNEQLLDPAVAFRKVSRILRVHFRTSRTATVGPDLSHRRNLANQVLRAPGVLRAIDADAGGDPDKRLRAEHKAREYVLEIAADMYFPTIRVVERLLGWVWTRIYDGIELGHVERLHEVARDKEVIYVPCHRSHFDYLLLAFVVYQQGLHLPHVAAGINLNLPIVGRILRHGGAFFLRRSFKGNRIYAAVFDAYLHEILTRGHSIEYFIEGGRSRTGRLLAPKAGMLAMTVNSYIRSPKRPVVFMPVCFGYEKLIEGDSFIKEMSGAEKRKESLTGLVRSIRSLREHFGKVYVNVGEPIELEPMLDAADPHWRDSTVRSDDRPDWVNRLVDDLSSAIMRGINSAAAVTPVSLLASVILCTPKQRIGAIELETQLKVILNLLQRFRYSASITIPQSSPQQIIAHGIEMELIERVAHPMGDVLKMSESNAVRMTYFRNNILHLLAVPASIACCFIHGSQLEHAELQRLVQLIYPFMQKELTLKWTFGEIDDVVTEAIESLIDLELLQRGRDKKYLVRPPAGSATAYQLLMLGQSMVPMLQRFYLVMATLLRHGSGVLSRIDLETRCQQSAERLSIIYGLHSPDFFDRTLFHDFIQTLRDQDVVRRNEDGLLVFDDGIDGIANDARLVLGEEIRHSILSLTEPLAVEDA